MSTKRIFLLLIAIFSLVSAWAYQPVALGQWRVHLPYNHVDAICETPDKIYCASENGLYSYSKADGITERLSPANGFSAYKVKCMAYDWNSGTLIIVYADSRIEMVKNKTIEKNDDVYRKTIVGEKTIHHIQISNNMAYISTSFGLLEFDFKKNEIKNSYLNIGPGGSVIDVYASTVLGDSIYISSKTGIYSGFISPSTNLADYTNWHLSIAANIKSQTLTAFNQSIYAELDSQLMVKKGNAWQVFKPIARKRIITNIGVQHDKLIIGSFADSIYTIDKTGRENNKGINVLNQSILDYDGLFWYSSPSNGLVLMHPNGEQVYYPNGPRSTDAFSFVNAYGNLFTLAGGFMPTTDAPTFNGNKYYYFNNFEWSNSPSDPFTYPLFDYITASYQKSNGRLYIGTFGRGILQLNNGVATKIYNETNSPLKKQVYYTIIRGLASDNRDNLWISNFNVDSALLRMSPSGSFTSFKLPVNKTGKIVIDNKNNKWILTPGESSGILAFNEKSLSNTNDDVSILVNTAKGTGNLPSNAVNDIAFTKSGELLIGTDQGFVRIRNPNNAFTGGDYDATSIVVSVDSNSNLGGKVLEKEVINCIVVDGGDRRWFGTNKGAWLYDSDGETLLQHFTKENSPLMSDNVVCIGIMESTGEVFFGTDQGIASFRSDAIPAAKEFSELVIFPNPVKPTYEGDIAITGMPDNTLVKITDINGALVYQTFSNGSLAKWNGQNFDGVKVSTGVYLVFCINAEGTESQVGKILFVH